MNMTWREQRDAELKLESDRDEYRNDSVRMALAIGIIVLGFLMEGLLG